MILTDVILLIMCPDRKTRENERYMNGNFPKIKLKITCHKRNSPFLKNEWVYTGG
jgi:hypothetical protein